VPAATDPSGLEHRRLCGHFNKITYLIVED
jgi:hypothetical protein